MLRKKEVLQLAKNAWEARERVAESYLDDKISSDVYVDEYRSMTAELRGYLNVLEMTQYDIFKLVRGGK